MQADKEKGQVRQILHFPYNRQNRQTLTLVDALIDEVAEFFRKFECQNVRMQLALIAGRMQTTRR